MYPDAPDFDANYPQTFSVNERDWDDLEGFVHGDPAVELDAHDPGTGTRPNRHALRDVAYDEGERT